ncbi:MAG: twin-arginine translocase subunit TatC [Deltaproteobacteria bacterium]|jgi:sec-independent protein translocase protein TatC|nr:twin-arginine translocase subunit TatC [Deltaproteobacteria bacterium]
MPNKNNKNKEPSKLNEAGRMSFVEHFSELRKRIIYVFIAIIICMGFSWHLSYKAINIIETPLEKPTYITYFAGYAKKIIKKKIPFVYYSFGLNKTPKKFQKHILHYSKPLEPFFMQVKVSLILGLMIAFPFILFEFWQFIKPGLLKKERMYLLPFLFFGTLFFISGVIFMVFYIWPAVINFSLSYQSPNLSPLINLTHYINFALRLGLIFGLIFELPLISALFSLAGILKPNFLKKYRKYALLISLIIAAFHADIVTMFFIAVPLYSMYEISILISSFIWRFKKRDGLTA